MLGVINSDEINKYNIKLTVGALESAYSENWQQGIPSLLGHDHTKPIAWTLVNGLHFEPGLVRTTSVTYIPETEKESKLIGNKINNFYVNKTTNFIKPYKNQLLDYVNPFINGDYMFYSTESAAIINQGIAKRIFPEIFETDDKHGLVYLSKLNPIAPGIYEKDGLLLYASKYFRRSFSRLNTLNAPFLERLQEIGENDTIVKKVLLDPDMIGLAESYSEVFEFQYWWGPKFSENIEDIPLGVTIHKNNEKDMLFNDVESTEFWWYEQDGKKTFECEEVIVRPSLGLNESSYGCRYVHSMVDEIINTPFHLDGAIRIYDEEGIIKRWDTDIKSAGKNTNYIKLWRLDGNITVSEWKELISHFFRDNILVGEYFGGEDNKKDFIPEIFDKKEENDPFIKYIPSNMQKGDGVRVALSYKSFTGKNKNGRIIKDTHFFVNNNGKIRYIESDTIEIIKLLRNIGESINIPPNMQIVNYDDMITNFPIILHTGQKAVSDANVTLRKILELCRFWKSKNDDRIITFNIAIQYKSKEVLFSFAGHIDDILDLFKNNNLKFPDYESEIGAWCEEIAATLTEKFPKSNDRPKLSEMLKESGILCFDRVFIGNKYKTYWDVDKKAYGINLELSESDSELIQKLEKKEIQLASLYLVNKSMCSKCRKEYKSCNCSKFSSDGSVEIMEDIKILGFFWTSRKA